MAIIFTRLGEYNTNKHKKCASLKATTLTPNRLYAQLTHNRFSISASALSRLQCCGLHFSEKVPTPSSSMATSCPSQKRICPTSSELLMMAMSSLCINSSFLPDSSCARITRSIQCWETCIHIASSSGFSCITLYSEFLLMMMMA